MNTLAPLAAAALFVVAACVAPDPEGARRNALELADTALGFAERSSLDAASGTTDSVTRRLEAPLDADAAVAIALARHRGLHAELARLGVAAADLAEAGTLSNPTLGVGVRFERGTAGVGRPEFALAQSLVELVTRRQRVAGARAALEVAQREVARALVDHAFETRAAFFRALAATELAELAGTAAEAASLEVELAERLHAAGNLNERELALATAESESARLEHSRAVDERDATREALTQALGLFGDEAAAWRLPERLPEFPNADPVVGERATSGGDVELDVEAYAIQHRLDLAAAFARVVAHGNALGSVRRTRWMPDFVLGVGGEREDGSWSFGPEAEFSLPIFDRGAAAIAGKSAELEAAEHDLAALAARIRSEARAAYAKRVHALARLRHLETRVWPAERRAFDATRREFDAMLVGVFELLRAKRAEVATAMLVVEARRDAWLADGELARVLGSPLPAVARPQAAHAEPTYSESDVHVHGD
ncbi:MAG: TolC family protein [Planctomycetes bacterium]|nr:TolC family protein [Planctomycetota bacterium]